MEQSSTGLVLLRCTHCGGSLRPGAPWCTLCLTRTAPDPEPEPVAHEPVASEPVASEPVDPLTAPLALLVPGEASAAGWPCVCCGTANAFDATSCAACGAGFLDSVRLSEPPLLRLPVVGDVARLDKPQLLALAFGFVLVAVLATLLLGVLLT